MTENAKPLERYFLLYLPFILATLFKSDAVISYFIAWLGSFFLFFVCYSGWIKRLPTDRPTAEQLMRPVFLVQIIFIGYTCCTSIFYFLNLLGINYIAPINYSVRIDKDHLDLAAQCQRYYVLGHAAFTSGLLLCMRYPVKRKYTIDNNKLANTLLIIAVVCLPASVILLKLPGFAQFSFQLVALSFIAGTLALAFAIPLNKVWNTVLCSCLYASNFYQALTSGFKEPIIISVLILGIFLYPSYKKAVALIFLPALLLLFIYLPKYNNAFRANAWAEGVDADDAYKMALEAALDEEADDDQGLWNFLVYRLSEIDMFSNFVSSTPEYIEFYDLELVKQSVMVVVPRVFWPSKPITEDLVMERVYDAGVVRGGSSVSAKPAYIVDGYLSGGGFGVFLSLFIYGAAAQLISQRAEYLFGGYILGTALIFSGLFQIFWRGLSFEFLLNNVVWSYLTMLIVHKILKAYNIIREA